MTPDAWRANIAGMFDGAEAIVGTVATTFSKASHLHVPPAVDEQIAEARRILRQLSEWMVDPHNSALEKRNG